MKSSLNQLPPQQVRDLPRALLLTWLVDYFHAPSPPAIVEAAYKKGAVKNTWQDYGDRLLAEYARRLNR